MSNPSEKLIEALIGVDDDLLSFIGLDKQTVLNGEDKLVMQDKVVMKTKKERLPRKLKKMIKKEFGEDGYLFFRSKMDLKMPERYIQMKSRIK